MKPDFPCPNHADSEGLFPCRYCGEHFCELCCQKDYGFYHCRSVDCIKAYQAEAKGPRRRCPYCGKKTNQAFPVCEECGEKNLHIPVENPESLVTIAKFGNINQATLAQTKLSSEDIPSFLADENINTLYAAGNTFTGGIRIQVRFRDAERATQSLATSEDELSSVSTVELEPTGSCRYCGVILSQDVLKSETNLPCCRKPGCLKAMAQELDSLKRFCSACGTEAPYPTYFCPQCGKKINIPPIELEPVSAPIKPLVASDKWGLGWAVLIWFFLYSIEHLSILIMDGIYFQKEQWPDPLIRNVIHYLGLFLCIFIVAYWIKRSNSLSWLSSLKFLGYKTPQPHQLLAGFLILVPFLIGNYFSLQGYQKEGVQTLLDTDWQKRLVQIFLGAGIFEETIYRGFLFQCLRRGRSFFTAAVISSGIWALSHVSHMIPYGGQGEPYHLTMAFLFGVFIHGILGCFLFEKGGNNIWGWMLFHIGYDSCFLLNTSGADFYISYMPDDCYWAGFWFTTLMAVPIILWLLPAKKSTLGDQISPRSLDNEVSLKWKPFIVPAVIVSSLIATFFLTLIIRYSDFAMDNHWKSYMENHPRYADGYRQWADKLYKQEKYFETTGKCSQALEIDPKNADAWLLWGKSLWQMDQYEGSAKKFQKVTELQPKRASAFLWWGWALKKTHQNDEAVDKFRTVIHLKPDETLYSDNASQQIDRIQRDENKR
jgi:membrane protease YdiL (CAAX protease family)